MNFTRPLGPFAVLYEQRPNFVKPKSYDKHPALRGRNYTNASALCNTKQERIELKNKFIAEYVLRVNKHTDLGAHGGVANALKGR